ncbi:Uncharacterised protein [BD1-7 clade bacterium]|uniref:Fe2OG dioxygenase domain-containing protein n=1 Tax=BD1-7 clade bacterium TaxID=2029982 RepID=A0A5S9N6F3_9GAMM|nr:Uncharacterised protein [BD1-7 clade bacterium]
MEFPFIESFDIFSTPVFVTQLPDAGDRFAALMQGVRECQKQQSTAIDSDVAAVAKQHMDESHLQLLEVENPAFEDLKHQLEVLVLAVAEEVNAEHWPEGEVAVARITESWYHVTRNGGYHDVHSHPNCSWCGIYCIDAGDCSIEKRSGVNRFYDPRVNAEHYIDAGTRYLSDEGVWDIVPQAGQLVIFPSYLKHSALPYFGTEDRVVIAFNAQVHFVDHDTPC